MKVKASRGLGTGGDPMRILIIQDSSNEWLRVVASTQQVVVVFSGARGCRCERVADAGGTPTVLDCELAMVVVSS